jgi:two-component system LytT family sensor kinase
MGTILKPLSPASRLSAKLTLVLWLAVLAFIAPATIFSGQVATIPEALTLLNGFVTALLFAGGLYIAFRRVEAGAIPYRLAAMGLLVFITACLQTAADFGSQYLTQALLIDVTPPPVNVRTVVLTIVIYLSVYTCNAALFWIVDSAQRAREQEIRLVNMSERAARSELDKLRLQLNPHFMGNALNAISTLILVKRHDEAAEMTDRLAAFLQSVMEDRGSTVTLAEELETVAAYLDVEAVRFNDRLQVRMDCPAALGTARLPPFILQPLVENAVRHAVAPSSDPVEITVAASTAGGELVLSIADTGRSRPEGLDINGHGIGLRNTRARLRMQYGDAGRLDTRPTPDGFTSLLRVPLIHGA